MPSLEERPLPTPWRVGIHAALLAGTAFFLLPLIWMIATSLKPLDQTLQTPESVGDALLAHGYEASLGGTTYEVTLHRRVEPTPDKPVYVVRTGESFAAGELSLPFGPEVWEANPVFSEEELRAMNATVRPGDRVLADQRNPYDPQTQQLRLKSGRNVPAELVREIAPPPEGVKLWMVREWRPRDTDTKSLTSMWDPTRAWDVLPRSEVRRTVREVFENYPVALEKVNFTRSLLNTLFICGMTVAGAVISSVVVAYGFAFLQFPGRKALFAVTLATIMVPFVVVLIPVYLLYRELGWVGTFRPLWVHWWFGNAFFIFLLRQFFRGLPRDLLDAARMDGCSELEVLWHVVVPLSRPAIALVALFAFLLSWKDFLGPLIYLSHESQFTLSLALQSFASEHGGTPWHLLMAAATVFSLPLIVLFFFTMKTFIRGVTMTGMKG